MAKKLFKNTLQPGTILWVGRTRNPRITRRVHNGRYENVTETIYYIKLFNPLARSRGDYIPKDSEFLKMAPTLGFKRINTRNGSDQFPGITYTELWDMRLYSEYLNQIPSEVLEFYQQQGFNITDLYINGLPLIDDSPRVPELALYSADEEWSGSEILA